jgi:hypothetical protein
MALVATAISSTQIDLTWTDEETEETGWEVLVSLLPESGYVPVDTLPANSTSYSHTGLEPSTTYYYAVRPEYSGGAHGASLNANATTLATPTYQFRIQFRRTGVV